MDPSTLRQRLTDVRQKIATLQRQIAEHRDLIAKLERAGSPTDHAKYLLAGLELLIAAQRDREKELRARAESSD